MSITRARAFCRWSRAAPSLASQKAKAFEQLPPEAAGLAPLLRGKTILATGPAEVSMAKQLLAFEKTMPDFTVLGALLHSRRVLQVREKK